MSKVLLRNKHAICTRIVASEAKKGSEPTNTRFEGAGKCGYFESSSTKTWFSIAGGSGESDDLEKEFSNDFLQQCDDWNDFDQNFSSENIQTNVASTRHQQLLDAYNATKKTMEAYQNAISKCMGSDQTTSLSKQQTETLEHLYEDVVSAVAEYTRLFNQRQQQGSPAPKERLFC
mmetsp:Transcript_14318/g.39088  ORF Transcript_14318/g.39088 Transcript_14318/m.39088 type:complete len:175 (-) Transcript_14318:72-596(-)